MFCHWFMLYPWFASSVVHQGQQDKTHPCSVVVSACACASRRVCLAAAVLSAVLAGALVAVLVLQPWTSQHRHQRFPRAAVASNGVECASIGRGILERNGSAADAAISTLLCEGIACAQCMGLGGGFLATIYDAGAGQVSVLNARERAPAATTANMYANASSTVGGLAIAVPGELRGYGDLHRVYGRLPWAELVRPVADLCRNGFRITEYMGRVLQSYSERIKNEPSMRAMYVNPATGEVWNEGDLVTDLTFAQTLDVIAAEGPEAIHNGTLTSRLVADISSFGGIITEEDLRHFRTEWQDPIAVNLSDEYTLYSVPLPGSGSVLAFIVNMLRGWVGAGSGVPAGTNLYWQRVVETFKYAYAKRTGLGDLMRDHSDLHYSMAELERNLSDAAWAESFRPLVTDDRTFQDWRHYGALFDGADDHGTAHVVVAAPDGSVVSITSTVNYIWGSQRRSSLGFILNNEMDDFAIPDRTSAYGMPPSPANMLAPGLQPLSSMVPTVVLSNNGQAELILGAAGGTKITTQVALTALNVILEREDIGESIQQPRLHHQLIPMEVEVEEAFSPNIVEFLKHLGHNITLQPRTTGFAALVAASRDNLGHWIPMTDPRRKGSTDGF